MVRFVLFWNPSMGGFIVIKMNEFFFNNIMSFYYFSVNMMDEQRAKNKVISKEFCEFKREASETEEKDGLLDVGCKIENLEGEKMASTNMLEEILKIVGKTKGRKLIPEELLEGKVVLY
jgi:hypothetical protein